MCENVNQNLLSIAGVLAPLKISFKFLNFNSFNKKPLILPYRPTIDGSGHFLFQTNARMRDDRRNVT